MALFALIPDLAQFLISWLDSAFNLNSISHARIPLVLFFPFLSSAYRKGTTTFIINVIVPFLFSLDKNRKRSSTGIRAGEILLELKAESNHIIKKWEFYGIRARNAIESQALLQLYNVYCKQKRCLDCQIGAESIKAAIHE